MLGAVAAAALLAGCAAGPDFVRPEAPADPRYLPSGMPPPTAVALGASQSFVPGAAVAPDWWHLFGSTELDSAMRAALGRNPTLQSAQASLRASQQNLQAGYGIFYPQLDLGLSVLRQRSSPIRAFANLPGVYNVFTLGATVSYLLDVSGGARRTVEALGAQADYQRYQLSATWLSLSGNIFNTLVARAGYAAQIGATRELIARISEQRDITNAQVAAGAAPYSTVLLIESQLASSEAALPVLQQRYDQAGHLFATLVGSTPAQSQPPQVSLERMTLPQSLPVTLPSDLVRQRPDVLSAEAQLHEASARIGIATAAMFPTFQIDGTYGTAGHALHDTMSAANRFWSAGVGVSQPVFRGGTLTHQRRAAVADYERALATYRETGLAAFAQVADALTALGNDARALRAQSHALESARQSLAMLQANYRAGLVSYLEVLVADEQLHRAQLEYVQAMVQRFQDTAALYLALGGGWWRMQRELEPAVPGGPR